MNRYAIIATRHTEEECNDENLTVGRLNKDLTSMGWDVRFMRDQPSIFSAYHRAVQDIQPADEDQFILCHDDIEILHRLDVFDALFQSCISLENTGFIGVAGSGGLARNANWVSSMQSYTGGGMISHGSCIKTMDFVAFYGTKGVGSETVAMDGVFLATTGKVLKKIELRKPKKFIGGWHWYDASYTLQAHLKGFTNRIVPLHFRHASTGDYNQSFYEDGKEFHR
jgi:hypothetical protein